MQDLHDNYGQRGGFPTYGLHTHPISGKDISCTMSMLTRAMNNEMASLCVVFVLIRPMRKRPDVGSSLQPGLLNCTIYPADASRFFEASILSTCVNAVERRI